MQDRVIIITKKGEAVKLDYTGFTDDELIEILEQVKKSLIERTIIEIP